MVRTTVGYPAITFSRRIAAFVASREEFHWKVTQQQLETIA